VHPNTIRVHVTALEQADVVESAIKPASGPGRPAAEYRLVEGWGLSSTDFLELAGLLASALVRAAPEADALRATGADWGRYLAGRPGVRDVSTEVPRALERVGFHATVTGDIVHISGCPCATVLPDHPEVVCALATGLAEGVLAAIGSPLRVTGYDRHPDTRRCTLRLDRPVA
jgi:predicted ArsR family transcriptional regulator